MKKCTAILLSSALLCSAVSCNSNKVDNSVSETVYNTDFGTSDGDNKEDIVLTMAIGGVDKRFYQQAVDNFNAEDNGYRIELKQYREYSDPEKGNIIVYDTEQDHMNDMEILQDIMNTDEIDIVCNASFSNEIYHEILQNKGAFADLYTFMENDDKVNTSTLNSHILELNEKDGKLYTLPSYFNVHTLIGDKKYVGDKENWTVDEFIEYWDKMPENSAISGSHRAEDVYYVVLRSNLEYFVDYENAEVNFDSPEFRQMLEFCNTFPSNNGQKLDYDYEAPNFVYDIFFEGINQVPSISGTQTLVGYPSFDGEGAYLKASGLCYSISAKSSREKQEGAWKFIRAQLTKETQLANVIESYTDPDVFEGEPVWSAEFGFCVNDEAFKQMAEDVTAQKFRQPDAYYEQAEYEPQFPTMKDVDKFREYIESIERWEVSLDRSLWEIINEEIMAYFKGEKTLDETVDIIQNRAQIWVSEQAQNKKR